MKRIAIISAFLVCSLQAGAQSVGELLGAILGMVAESVAAVPSDSENKVGVPQQNLATWHIEPANYSGITPLGDGRYAVVSDKGDADGFYIWKISQDPASGKILSVESEGFFANRIDATPDRDCEGVVYNRRSRRVYIGGEGDQRILAYNLEGQRTGEELVVPAQFKDAVGNQGLEALGFGGRGRRSRFWTTTETMLPSDGAAAGPNAPGATNLLRIQSFGRDLQPAAQYAYKMDPGRASDFGPTYVFGVPEICALPDGRLLVLEREANIPKLYVGADVHCKIYAVRPRRNQRIDPAIPLSELEEGLFLEKELVAEWTTILSAASFNWANYEGMCLGEKLSGGKQSILLVSDSQGGYGKGPIRLQDFIKVIFVDLGPTRPDRHAGSRRDKSSSEQ